jgi:hypothetical protein
VEPDEKDTMSDEDGFEIVEKVKDCLNISETPAAPEAAKENAKSFFSSTADVDNHPTGNTEPYAHLPLVETPKLLQAPSTIPSLFPLSRTTVYVLLGPDTTQKEVHSITLRATGPDGPLELGVPVRTANTGTTIHQLGARKAIQELEDGRGWLYSATTGVDKVTVRQKFSIRFDGKYFPISRIRRAL